MVCQNCGQSNDNEQNYCRHCGASLLQAQRQKPTPPQPKPYGWASPSSPLHNVANGEKQIDARSIQPLVPPNYQPPSAVSTPNAPNAAISQNFIGYRCPRCGASALPIVQKKISEGGWIVFVLMLLFCFPLFFIGLLMREEHRACPACLAQIG